MFIVTIRLRLLTALINGGTTVVVDRHSGAVLTQPIPSGRLTVDAAAVDSGWFGHGVPPAAAAAVPVGGTNEWVRTGPDGRVLVPVNTNGRVMTGPDARAIVAVDDGDTSLTVEVGPDTRVFLPVDSDGRLRTGSDDDVFISVGEDSEAVTNTSDTRAMESEREAYVLVGGAVEQSPAEAAVRRGRQRRPTVSAGRRGAPATTRPPMVGGGVQRPQQRSVPPANRARVHGRSSWTRWDRGSRVGHTGRLRGDVFAARLRPVPRQLLDPTAVTVRHVRRV